MGRPYSDDLRERVLKEAERSSARRAAVRFGISAATAVRWAGRARLGERSAQPWGGRRGSRLDAHAEFVETMIQDRKDIITLDEMVERLATERDLHLSRSALSAWLRRQGWTFNIKTAQALEQDRPDVLRRRQAWFEGQLDLDPTRLVFING